MSGNNGQQKDSESGHPYYQIPGPFLTSPVAKHTTKLLAMILHSRCSGWDRKAKRWEYHPQQILVSTLARDLHLGRNTVKRGLQEARELGWIDWEDGGKALVFRIKLGIYGPVPDPAVKAQNGPTGTPLKAEETPAVKAQKKRLKTQNGPGIKCSTEDLKILGINTANLEVSTQEAESQSSLEKKTPRNGKLPGKKPGEEEQRGLALLNGEEGQKLTAFLVHPDKGLGFKLNSGNRKKLAVYTARHGLPKTWELACRCEKEGHNRGAEFFNHLLCQEMGELSPQTRGGEPSHLGDLLPQDFQPCSS